jgi:xylulokinase
VKKNAISLCYLVGEHTIPVKQYTSNCSPPINRNADVPRALVRDMYTKSWSAFDRLVAIVPPGGSIGYVFFVCFCPGLTEDYISLDDKLFSFWLLQGDAFPFSHVNGIFRFETGVKVNEFRDLRANPRCLLESQLLSFRVRWSRMIGTGLLGPSPLRGIRRATTPTPGQASGRPQLKSAIAQSLGLSFDPYDSAPLPTRIIATGAAANFPAISNLVGDIFDAPVLIPTTQVDSAQTAPHRNAPAPGFPARAALGGAYVARWVWGREARQSQGAGGAGKTGGFEEEIRRLLGKRWVSSGGTPPRTNVNSGGLTSGHNSGTSTPLRHGAGTRSMLGSTVVVEEDEDEVEEMERSAAGYSGSGMGVGLIGAGLRSNFADLDLGPTPRARTVTSSTDTSTTPSIGQASSTLTTPDLNNPGATIPAGGSAPLVPVQALPSTGDSELQLGLVKVAEPDSDAFMTYAAIVPEFCRLEAMLVKSIA